MMIKLYVIISLLCLIDVGKVSGFCDGLTASCMNYQRIYNSVNDYLVENQGENSDPQRNFELAIKWLEGKATKGLFGENNYAAAKKQLESLKDLPLKCDSESFAIIKKNYRATGEWFDRFQQERIKKSDEAITSLRPIDRIVLFYVAQNAKNCMPKYGVDLKDALNRLESNSTVPKLALGWLNGAFQQASGQNYYMCFNQTTHDRLYDDISEHLIGRINFWSRFFGQIGRRRMEYIAFEFLTFLQDEHLIWYRKSWYLKNVVVRDCKRYIDKLDDFPLAASSTERNVLISLTLKSKEDFLRLFHFNIGYAGLKLCQYFIKKQSRINKLEKDLHREMVRYFDEAADRYDREHPELTSYSSSLGYMGAAAIMG